MNLSSWVLTIVGMVVLSVIGDIILPQGKIAKTVKGVFAFITVLVIASPLPELFNGSFEVFFSLTDETHAFDEQISQTIYQMRVEQACNQIETTLGYRGVDNPEITIISENKDTFLAIEKIIINLDNAVIKEVDGNIIKTETIRQVVAESVGVAEEKVVVYE